MTDLRLSRYYETEPGGVEPQPLFLNAAAVGTCDVGAVSCFAGCSRLNSSVVARGHAPARLAPWISISFSSVTASSTRPGCVCRTRAFASAASSSILLQRLLRSWWTPKRG